MVGKTIAMPCLAAAFVWAAVAERADAYTATGDRVFPATLVLLQIAPGDELYLNYSMLPLSGGTVGAPNRASNFTATYGKTITDRLGVYVEETYTGIGQVGSGTLWGWQNLDDDIKYLAVDEPDHEFLLTLGLDREWGGTGAARVGASPSGATTPQLYFGKGFGDLDLGYLRPLALTGFSGVQLSDSAPRPDVVSNGFVVEYSIPYLQSKVQSYNLPQLIRGLTPLAEFLFTSPLPLPREGVMARAPRR